MSQCMSAIKQLLINLSANVTSLNNDIGKKVSKSGDTVSGKITTSSSGVVLEPTSAASGSIGSLSKYYYDIFTAILKLRNGSYTATLSFTTATSTNRALKLPDEDGTLATKEWTAKKPMRYGGTVANDGYLHVEHNLNISGNMYPVVSYAITSQSPNACVVYAVRYQNANRFDVGIMLANGYQLTSAVGQYVDINWTY